MPSVGCIDFWKRRGNEAFVVKEYKKASEAYSSAIKLKGDNGTLWSNRSACYLGMRISKRRIE